MRARWLPFVSLIAALVAGCRDGGSGADPLRPHYLIDFGGGREANGDLHITGHLLVFNPGEREAHLKLVLYFEDRDPRVLEHIAAPGRTSETSSLGWGVPQGVRFALEVRSDVAVVCQATIGWTNTGGDYSPGARTSSPRGVRETAKSYMATRDLTKRARIADGLILDGPQSMWIRESEWALLLNPGDAPAHATLSMFGEGWQRKHEVDVPPRRLRALYMDDIAPRNAHYGAEISSDRPIATQWVREVRWNDSPEMMAFWSVPGAPD